MRQRGERGGLQVLAARKIRPVTPASSQTPLAPDGSANRRARFEYSPHATAAASMMANPSGHRRNASAASAGYRSDHPDPAFPTVYPAFSKVGQLVGSNLQTSWFRRFS
jgi:hypothetical protein